MRINSSPYVPTVQAAATTEAMRERHQVSVLKKALDSQKTAAGQLLQMLDPKGSKLDIRA